MNSFILLKDYQNSWALVTGASSGIGAEFCRQLAAYKINLILVARRTEKLTRLSTSLEAQFGIQTLVITQDLSVAGSAEKIKFQIENRGIKVRLLVNNAGYGPWGRFERLSPGHEEKVVQLLLGTPAALIRTFLDHFQTFSSSVIINLSSQAALQPIPYLAAYSAAKAGLHNLSLALYEEYKERFIYVQTLIPGPTQTEFDEVGEAYPSGISEKRDTPEKVVTLSLKAVRTKEPVVAVPSIFMQRFFNGVFPPKVVVKKIGKIFRPPAAK